MTVSTERQARHGAQPQPFPPYVQDVLDVAAGRAHREDPALPRTGGPAGNARLTAWTGLLLLVLFLAELVTLLSVQQLISWHIALGAALIPPALVKTGTTGWRMVRYYAGSRSYKEAGPPPLLLRLLGPLVVLTTVGLLATGTVVGVVGLDRSFRPLVTVAGHGVSLLLLHKAFFVVWGASTGLHVLARLVPALRSASGADRGAAGPDGRWLRASALVLTTALAAVCAAGVLSLSSSWRGITHEVYPGFSQDR